MRSGADAAAREPWTIMCGAGVEKSAPPDPGATVTLNRVCAMLGPVRGHCRRPLIR